MQAPEIAGLTDLRKIGEGGFGIVYAARQDALDRQVAVKVLTAAADDSDAAKRFRREAAALGRLSGHPNIVAIHDILSAADERICLIMQYVTGGSMQDRIARQRVHWTDVARDGVQVAGALQTAHDEGVLHRDIKPDNILYGRLGEPQLADFGIARLADATSHTRTGSISATLAYAPPEVLDGRPPSPASDVYSLAATLVAAIRGVPAFCEDQPGFPTLLARIATQAPPELRSFGVPGAVARVLALSMAKDPASRPQSASIFGSLLIDACRSVGCPVPEMPYSGRARRGPSTVSADRVARARSAEKDQPYPSRRRGQRAIALVAGLLVASLGIAALLNGADEQDQVAGEMSSLEPQPLEAPFRDDGEDGRIPEAPRTEDVEVELPPGGVDALRMAYVLPETGNLAFLGPPIIAGFQLAIEDINAAGGVNGVAVVTDGGDEGDGDGFIANQTVDRLLADGVQMIVGAASTQTSLSIIDKVTTAGVVQCSPSNTAPTFTTYDDGGYYFRTSPSDAYQGPALAEQIVAAGSSTVAILARADLYGEGLLEATRSALEERGIVAAIAATYDPAAQSYEAEVQRIRDVGADAVVLISFDEGVGILQTMVEAGVGPTDISVFGADGLGLNSLAGVVDASAPGILQGMRITSPIATRDRGFDQRLLSFRPALDDTLFGAESYDCAILGALAAHAGESNSAAVIATNMSGVASRSRGVACESFAECKDLLDDGQTIRYTGISGSLALNEFGEPDQGVYAVSEFDANGRLNQVATTSVP